MLSSLANLFHTIVTRAAAAKACLQLSLVDGVVFSRGPAVHLGHNKTNAHTEPVSLARGDSSSKDYIYLVLGDPYRVTI